MKKIIGLVLALFIGLPAFAGQIGTVDYKKVIENYSKAKTAISQIQDRELELQRYILDKEKELKKIESPIQKKSYGDTVAKEFAKKEQAYINFRIQKEEAVDKDIMNAIKQVAIENKLDSVVDHTTVFFGGVDITDKVIKKLNLK